MSIDPSHLRTVETLLELTTQLDKAVGKDKITEILGKIYIRSEVKEGQTPKLKIERGGFWHPIQALQRAFDPDSYRITVVKGNNVLEGETYKLLNELHRKMEQIPEEDLAELLNELKKQNPSVDTDKTKISKSLGNLKKVIDYVEKQKINAIKENQKLKEGVEGLFKQLVFQFGRKTQVTQPPVEAAVTVLRDIKQQRILAEDALKKANSEIKEEINTLEKAQKAIEVLKSALDTAFGASKAAEKLLDEARPTIGSHADFSQAEAEKAHCTRAVSEIRALHTSLSSLTNGLTDLLTIQKNENEYAAQVKAALERAQTAATPQNLEEALKIAEDAVKKTESNHDKEMATITPMKTNGRATHFGPLVGVAEKVIEEINKTGAQVHIDCGTIKHLLAEKEAEADINITQKARSFLDAVKAQRQIAKEQLETVTASMKEPPKDLDDAKNRENLISAALKTAEDATQIAQTEVKETQSLLQKSPRKPEVAQQHLRDATSLLGECAEDANLISQKANELKEIIKGLETAAPLRSSVILQTPPPETEEIKARATRQKPGMPEGPKEKALAKAYSLHIPEWITVNRIPKWRTVKGITEENPEHKRLNAVSKSLPSLINLLQVKEDDLEVKEKTIEKAQEGATKLSADRSVGLCKKELSNLVEQLQGYFKEEPQASAMAERIGLLETFLAKLTRPEHKGSIHLTSYNSLVTEIAKLVPVPEKPVEVPVAEQPAELSKVEQKSKVLERWQKRQDDAAKIGFWALPAALEKYRGMDAAEFLQKQALYETDLARLNGQLESAELLIAKTDIVKTITSLKEMIQKESKDKPEVQSLFQPLDTFFTDILRRPATFLTIAARENPDKKLDQAVVLQLQKLQSEILSVAQNAKKIPALLQAAGKQSALLDKQMQETEAKIEAFLEKHKGSPEITFERERNLHEAVDLIKFKKQVFADMHKIVQRPEKQDAIIQDATKRIEYIQKHLDTTSRLVSLTDGIIEALKNFPEADSEMRAGLLELYQIADRNFHLARVGRALSFDEIKEVVKERLASILDLKENEQAKSELLKDPSSSEFREAAKLREQLFTDAKALQEYTEKKKLEAPVAAIAPQEPVVTIAKPAKVRQEVPTTQVLFSKYNDLFTNTIELNLETILSETTTEQERIVAFVEDLGTKLTEYLEKIESVETEIVTKPGRFWGTYQEEVPSDYSEEKSGGLSRGIYADTWNQLSALKSTIKATDDPKVWLSNFEQFAKLLTYASSIERSQIDSPETMQAKRAVMLVRLYELVRKSEDYLTNFEKSPNAAQSDAIRNCYAKLGVPFDERRTYLFSPERLNTISTNELIQLETDLTKLLENSKLTTNWSDYYENSQKDIRIRSYANLTDELATHFAKI